MIKSIYSSCKPSFGISVGNVQITFDRHTNLNEASKKVVIGVVSRVELFVQANRVYIYPKEENAKIFAEFTRHRAYFVPMQNCKKLENILFVNRSINRDITAFELCMFNTIT